MKTSFLKIALLCVASFYLIHLSSACRIGSEKLRSYTKKSIERLLDAELLESVYWPEEPLDAGTLKRVTGINITRAETSFDMDRITNLTETKNDKNRSAQLRDIFITCSVDRDRIYTLTINLELTNPFKVIDLHFQYQKQRQQNDSQETGLFRIRLPQSTFLVQLNQRINYDECLDIVYVQLAPNVAYEVECIGCSDEQQIHLDKIFSKRMTQLDAELDSMLSEKLLLDLQTRLNQKRLDLDLYLN